MVANGFIGALAGVCLFLCVVLPGRAQLAFGAIGFVLGVVYATGLQ